MAAAQNVRSRSIPRTHRRSIPPIHTLLKKQNSFEIWDHLHNFAYLLHSTRPDHCIAIHTRFFEPWANDKKHSKWWCVFATLFVCLDAHASVYIRLWSFVSTYEIAYKLHLCGNFPRTALDTALSMHFSSAWNTLNVPKVAPLLFAVWLPRNLRSVDFGFGKLSGMKSEFPPYTNVLWCSPFLIR